jgi:hypothetical protein
MAELTIAEHAELLHAEHHSGTFVPTLDSCDEHTREEYEQLAAQVQALPSPGKA